MSGSILKGRLPHMSQISDPQAFLVESSTVTAQGQVKAKASQLLHMQSVQQRRTLQLE